jgi:hypothetical protein
MSIKVLRPWQGPMYVSHSGQEYYQRRYLDPKQCEAGYGPYVYKRGNLWYVPGLKNISYASSQDAIKALDNLVSDWGYILIDDEADIDKWLLLL